MIAAVPDAAPPVVRTMVVLEAFAGVEVAVKLFTLLLLNPKVKYYYPIQVKKNR